MPLFCSKTDKPFIFFIRKKDVRKTESAWEYCMNNISNSVSSRLDLLIDDIKNQVQEIRIRNGLPLSVTIAGKSIFVLRDGQTSYNPENAYICSENDIDDTYLKITNSSVYAHIEEIKEGFIRMPFGCRAGISGSFSDTGMIFDISGINIRIAKEFIGCADDLFAEYSGGGALISGPPGSGKTTVLRDFIRQLSNKGKRVSVIDSRGEISASSFGKPFYDLGPNTDTYIATDRSFAIIASLRTMFPQVIAFDELGTMAELESVKDGFNAGVEIITTAHVGDAGDIKSRKVVYDLVRSGAVKSIFLLSGNIGEKPLKLNSEDVI